MDKIGKVKISLEYYEALKNKEIAFENIAKEFNEYKSEEIEMLVKFLLRLKEVVPMGAIEDAMTSSGHSFICDLKTGVRFSIGKGEKTIVRHL